MLSHAEHPLTSSCIQTGDFPCLLDHRKPDHERMRATYVMSISVSHIWLSDHLPNLFRVACLEIGCVDVVRTRSSSRASRIPHIDRCG
jgi:hypothetical protein